jgi:uncharacterized membrane protein
MESAMKRMLVRGAVAAGLLSAAMLAALASATPRAVAASGAWCVVSNTGSENCGFTTMAQCAASASGFGGFCRMIGDEAPVGRRRN